MTYPFRLKLDVTTVVALVIALLLLAVAFPTPVAATPGGPASPGDQEIEPGGKPGPGQGEMDKSGNGGNENTEKPVDDIIPIEPEPGGDDGTMTDGDDGTMTDGDDGTMTDPEPGPHASALADRIVFHAATPAQLVKSGDGLQYYFLGADGSTVTGPHIPSFSELAEMHPSGDWVSLLDATNMLTGKQVYVDYIPNEQKIRVFTYYPDKGQDVNKPYIFNFGSDYAINVEAW
jgi:hypothetical protein